MDAHNGLIAVICLVVGFVAGAFIMHHQTFSERCMAHFERQTIEWYRCVEQLRGDVPMSEILEDAR